METLQISGGGELNYRKGEGSHIEDHHRNWDGDITSFVIVVSHFCAGLPLLICAVVMVLLKPKVPKCASQTGNVYLKIATFYEHHLVWIRKISYQSPTFESWNQ